jgi:hypothetical protein
MEKSAATGAFAGRRWEIPLGRCAAVVLAVVASPSLWAQEAVRSAMLDEVRKENPVRIEVTTSTLPRVESLDGFQAPRVDLAFLPGKATMLGPVVGMSMPRTGAPAFGLNAPRSSSTVDFGLRLSHKMDNQQQVDVTAWRRMNTEDDAYTQVQLRQPVYGARVEMNLATAKRSGFAAERGFIGLQLESGARITLKRKDGRPMVYYRTAF